MRNFVVLSAILSALPLATAEAGVTVVHLSPLDLRGSRIEGLSPLPFEEGLLQGVGRLVSTVIEAEHPFDDLVGSWNAKVPKGASVEMQAQARIDGRWTKWYKLGRWVPGAPESFDRQEDDDGFVETDVLRLKRRAEALRYQIVMTAEGARHAHLSRVAVAYEDHARKFEPSEPFSPGPWVRELTVRGRSQMTEQAEFRRDICSPTSLAMALDFWGKRFPTPRVVEAVRDRAAGIYGNWPLNVAAAAEWDLAGQVARLPSLSELQDEIAAGRPVVVSVSFGEGELEGAPLKKTRGHLFVVAGFDKHGDVIVQDPAAPDARSTRRVYKREEFERAWLKNKRGLAYLLAPRFPELLAVGVPTADVRTEPKLPRKPQAEDPGLATQALYGELVKVTAARGEWVKVEAVEQPYPGRAGWQGYPGWMRAEDLRKPPIPYRPSAVVRLKRAALDWEDTAGSEESLTLPIGAVLEVEHASGSSWTVRLLGGRPAKVQAAALRLSTQAVLVDRRDIIEAAASFLGDCYVWGGRSSLQKQPGWGVDCSGLIHLSYRSAGVRIPRDAHHQFLQAKPLRAKALKPGDLVFLTQSARSKRVNHVLMYTGGDELIESRVSAGKTVRTSFAERFGAPLKEIESGDIVPDVTKKRAFRRRIHFGTLLEDK